MEIILKRVNKCCCCLGVNLKIGALIILWLGIVCPSISLLLLTFLLSDGNWDTASVNGSNAMVDVCFEIVFWFFGILVILFQFLPRALALYGVYRNKPDYLQPYIFLNMVGLLFYAICLIILALSMLVVGANYDGLEKHFRKKFSEEDWSSLVIQVPLFFSMIVTAIGAAVSYYFTSVVHSQYQKMKKEMNKHFGSTFQYDAYDSEIMNSRRHLAA